MINKLYSMLALLMFSGLVNAYTVYTDKTAWENALPSASAMSTEDFEDNFMVPGLVSYTIPQGIYTVLQNFNLTSLPNLDGQAFIEMVDGRTPPRTTVWSFSSPSIAFGGNWDLSPAQLGSGIAIKINGNIQISGISTSHVDGGFWGFVAEEGDSPFLFVELIKPVLETGTEVFHLDNMVFAAAVPLPAAIWLLGLGIIGLFGYKKRFSH